jgi:outer membrane protein OmpA-like peptidoglycan-associated protein
MKIDTKIAKLVSRLKSSSLIAIAACAFTAPFATADDATVPHSYLVFFDFNKSVLTPAAVKIVDDAAADIATGKPAQIEVTGYTDTVGSDAYNLRLSKRRALAVEEELAKQGVAPGSIAIYAKGKHDLLVPTKDGVKEPQNRRAVIAYATPAAPAAPAVEEAKPDEAPATPPPVFGVWAQLESGITANPDQPHSGINYGHLFTDKTNQLVLNQLLVTAERPIDPNATDYDIAYRAQGMFGTDARYTHFLGELDTDIHDRTQLDIVEAWVNLHTPWLTDGGMDIKVGQFVTYLGAETIDPSGNFLYSKSYIFNFGIPLKHTGFMTITHVNPTVDVYLGADTGVNTSLGDGDNNSAFAFQGGFGLNGLLDGKLTVLAITHLGPENPSGPPATVALAPYIHHPNSDFRFLNDILLTYKPSDSLTLLTEFNYIQDEAYHAIGYGAAEYVKYAVSDEVAVVGRAEIWRDNNNFFVAGFPGNNDFVNLERGFPNQKPYVFSPAATTYGEVTLGLNITPTGLPSSIQALTIRPEIRLDGSLNGTSPFADGTNDKQFTFGLDFILKI